jgi:hypothetical protein
MFFDFTVINADPGTLTVKSFADLPRQIRSYDSHNNFLLDCSGCDSQIKESEGMATATAMPVKERPPSR